MRYLTSPLRAAVVPVLIEDILGRQLAIATAQLAENATSALRHGTGVVILELLIQYIPYRIDMMYL